MGPQPKHFHGLMLKIHLIHEPMLDVDASGIGSCEIPDQFFKRRRIRKRVISKEFQQSFNVRTKIQRGGLFRIPLCLFRKIELPTHHLSVFEHLSSGCFIPAMTDSRIPGTDSRCKVSWMFRQSSSEISTALARLPVI